MMERNSEKLSGPSKIVEIDDKVNEKKRERSPSDVESVESVTKKPKVDDSHDVQTPNEKETKGMLIQQVAELRKTVKNLELRISTLDHKVEILNHQAELLGKVVRTSKRY